MKKIMLCINDYDDREKMVSALANNGYSVHVKVEEDNSIISVARTYWVIFELPDLNIKD